jgi:hypothetical protein
VGKRLSGEASVQEVEFFLKNAGAVVRLRRVATSGELRLAMGD